MIVRSLEIVRPLPAPSEARPLRAKTHVPPRGALFIQRVLAVFVIGAFMISIYRYKTWYIALAMALAVTAGLVVLGMLRYRGLLAAVFPVALYYGWAFATALWAKYPGLTIWFATADSIGLFVAAFFYVLALNQPHRIPGIFKAFAWVALPITAYIYFRDPDASRSGGYAISVLPFVPPFCWAEITRRRKTVRAWLALLLVFGILIFARSRTPILVAIVTTGLAVFLFSRNIVTLLKRTLIALVVMVLTFGFLVYFKPTREIALITYGRFAKQDVVYEDIYIPAEPDVDPLRENLHWAAAAYIREFPFFGMGYHNFPPYFAREWAPDGEGNTLHSMYETWWVEGGLVMVGIVLVMFYRQFQALVRAMRWSADGEVRVLARVMIIATLGSFVFGMFHQTHVNPMLFALLGMGAALPRTAPLLRAQKKAGR